MKKLVILFLLIFVTISYSQTKYLIYFKDKGIQKTEILNKASPFYTEAINSLSERSIERRRKSMGNNFITYEDIPVSKDYLKVLSNSGIKIENKLKWFNAVSAYLSDEQKNAVLKFSFVQKVEPVKILIYKRVKSQINKPSLYKNAIIDGLNYGPSFGQDNLIDIPKVQSKGLSGEGVVIGLLDSGFRWKVHEALSARKVIAEYDFVFNDSVTANQPGDISKQDSHGTGVFSIIGGYKDGEIIGPAYNASYILAKTEDERSETHVEEDNYARALIWMDSIGVDITSSSLGYNEFDDSTYSYTYKDMDGKTTIVTKAAELAFQRGILTITSAGNEGHTAWHYIIAPADGINTIAVGAVDKNNVVAYFSSRGPSYDGRIKPDILAQGVNVYHADLFDPSGYNTGDGTSYSAPLAAGTAALLLSAWPYLSNVQARDILLTTADNFFTPDSNRGYGLVSASRAISYPNFKYVNGEYILHKIFLDHDRIDPSSVVLNYSEADLNINHLTLNYDGKLKYDVVMPTFTTGTKVDFYFTYSDSTGNVFREPVNINYSFVYGNFKITGVDTVKQIINVPQNFVLTQNYPNPFNNRTVIIFNSEINSEAKLIVYNSLGEKVKVLFSGITPKKENRTSWDGTTNLGTQAASGIYFYVLNLNGQIYSKKMVYLK